MAEPAGVAPALEAGVERRRLRVTGTVQGVGFRPFVYRHATRLGLAGFVRNDSSGVLIEAEGPAGPLASLCRLLVDASPPLARVESVEVDEVPALGEAGFLITPSAADGTADVAVSVDTGTCEECLAEVGDPGDRRFGYPFTNCTNCGPRYTIVLSVPYDRPATTMASFPMCPACRREYDDPSDRRFHAQPNACPVCGPALRWMEAGGVGGDAVGGSALAGAVACLGRGGVVAIKGIGGYHLAADATSASAVGELRRRKARDDKPFAVMVPDLSAAARLVELTPEAAACLSSPRRPIVLAPRRPDAPVAPGVAPRLSELGVMLAYSPLHHLLMESVGRPLVMTSGNLSDEPIAYTDEDAARRLGPLVDGFLSHNRPIHIRCDDSVVRATGARLQVVRRSRGYAPEPIALPAPAPRPLLAVGAELKSTVAVAKGGHVVASHHLGDLEHLATYRSFVQAIDHLCHLCGVTPEQVVHDLHPEYLSTKLATDLDLPALAVQHHHAHVASCLVDHHRTGPVLGVAFDGLGYGGDGTLWGGELLVADLRGYQRVGHLATVPLPGGAAAVKEPWRMALAWVERACGAATALEVGRSMDPRAAQVVQLLVGRGDAGARGAGALTSSAGRLFDAVAALVCRRLVNNYEGQAAIELEALARTAPGAGAYPLDLLTAGDQLVLDPSPLVAAAVEDLRRRRPAALVAAAFHSGVARGTVAAAVSLARAHGLDTVALSGGVFQNALLSTLVEAGLARAGLEVLVHRHVPPNDGGISIGQAAIGACSPL